jgi:hypothetical protein
VKLREGRSILTHGPDFAPPAAPDTAAAASPRPPLCTDRNPSGSYHQVAIVAWPSDRTPNETTSSLRSRIDAVNGLLHQQAVESGSPNGADYVFACDATGQVRVDRVALPTRAGKADFSTIISDLQALGYNKTNEKYVVWYDDRTGISWCGEGSITGDERDTAANVNNRGPDFGISYDCNAIMHEHGHNVGAVQYNSPFSTGDGSHCWQEYDVMCYSDGGDRFPGSLTYSCTDFSHYDCQHNDYFDAKIGAGEGVGAGSYLDTKWNIGECYVRWIVNYACASPPVPYRSLVMSHTPLGYWRLGEQSGSSAADETGKFGATYAGGVALGRPGALSGDPNAAVALDGRDDSVALPDLDGLNLAAGGQNTVEFWMRWDGKLSMPFGWGSPYDLLISPGSFGFNTGNGDLYGISSAGLTNRWVNVAAVFTNGQPSANKLYVDGVERALTQRQGTSVPRSATAGARLGRWLYDASYHFGGSLDEFAVYPRALTAAEAASHYEAGVSRYQRTVMADGPSGYWRLGETSGASAGDASGNNKEGIYYYGVGLGAAGALTGDQDRAASFDGVDDFVSAQNLGLSGPFTLELWAFLRGPGSSVANDYGTLIGYDYRHRLLWRVSDGRLLTQFDGNFFSSATAAPQAWHHIVYTFDGATERFYVDGIAAGSHATTAPAWNAPFAIGVLATDATQYRLNGMADEVAVYPKALSATTVRAHYDAGLGR